MWHCLQAERQEVNGSGIQLHEVHFGEGCSWGHAQCLAPTIMQWRGNYGVFDGQLCEMCKHQFAGTKCVHCK